MVSRVVRPNVRLASPDLGELDHSLYRAVSSQAKSHRVEEGRTRMCFAETAVLFVTAFLTLAATALVFARTGLKVQLP